MELSAKRTCHARPNGDACAPRSFSSEVPQLPETYACSPTTPTQIANCKRTTNTACAVMVQFKNVKATVIRYSDKKPFSEYKSVQNATEQSPDAKKVYIEVVPGERFAVVINILPNFDFQSSPDIRIRCSADGMFPKRHYRSKKYVNNNRSAAARNQRRVSWEQNTKKVDGRWMEYGLVFAELQLGIKRITIAQFAHQYLISLQE